MEIVRDAVGQLNEADLEVGVAERDALVSSFLVVLCSGQRAQRVLQVQSTPRLTVKLSAISSTKRSNT